MLRAMNVTDGALVPSRASAALMDVLEELPRDVLRDNVWLHLQGALVRRHPSLPSSTLGRAFRLTSHGSRRLIDQLTRRVELRWSSSDNDEAQCQGAFLARQEGLVELTLEIDDTGGEEHLVAALQRGGAVSRQLKTLHLSNRSVAGLSSTTAEAVRLCCPRLTQLDLQAEALNGPFFASFRDCQTLVQVQIRVHNIDSFDYSLYLVELAALPGLRSLAVDAPMDLDDLQLLAALTALTHLSLDGIFSGMWGGHGDALGRVLGGLTRLVTLDLTGWEAEGHEECTVQASAIVAQLGGLQRLSSFSLHSRDDRVLFTLDGAAYDAVCRLGALTQLTCGDVPEAVGWAGLPDGGALPLLQRLYLTAPLGSGTLASMLRPLRPLPQLRSAHLEVCLDDDLVVRDEDPAFAAGRQAVAMWQAAALLAAAPQLEELSLTICRMYKLPLSWGSATALLVPLRDRLTTLVVMKLPAGALEVLWPLLCLAPRLADLRIKGCFVSEGGLLLAVGQHLPALIRLSVQKCRGVTGDSAVALAVVCVRPLNVSWLPALTAEQRLAFEAVAREGVVAHEMGPPMVESSSESNSGPESDLDTDSDSDEPLAEDA